MKKIIMKKIENFLCFQHYIVAFVFSLGNYFGLVMNGYQEMSFMKLVEMVLFQMLVYTAFFYVAVMTVCAVYNSFNFLINKMGYSQNIKYIKS